MLDVPLWAWQVLVVAAGLFSIGALLVLARPKGRWGLVLRKGFLGGVPLGTVLTIGVVLSFYLFVQGGWWHWSDPLVIPFRAWSYTYPLGILTAGLAHAGPGHLIGNLLGTVAFAPLAEYAWGHFPRERGAQTFTSLRTNPLARAVVFPVAAVVFAVLGGVFGLGPVIGFSGVVFAFAGFALVRYPLVTVAVVLAGDVVNLTYRALVNPQVVGSPGVTYTSPWWAGIAIQGHMLGLLMGVAAGVLLIHYRGESPPTGRVWFAALAFTATNGMWAVYLYQGGSYVLLRALGVALLFLLATVVATAIAASDRPLVPALDLDRREAAVGLLLCLLLATALVAVPYNLLAFGGTEVPEGAVQAQDYTVYYAEDVQNQLVAAYDVPFYNTSNVTASGVIVFSEQRGIWWEAVSKGALAFRGRAEVTVGGLGWRQDVVANRTGWNMVGGNTTYEVYLRPRGGDRVLAYSARPATAGPTIAGRNVTVSPVGDGFDVLVSTENTTLGRVPVPAKNESVDVGGLTISRTGRSLYAVYNETRVEVAKKETYR